MKERADTTWIVEQAKGAGFDLCGMVRAEKFPELENTPDWLARGYAGEMKYLFDSRREDPRSAMPGVRSVIVCLLNYNTGHPLSTDTKTSFQKDERKGWVSRYGWGDDYHDVLLERLEALIALLQERFVEPFEARAYVDTGPIQERLAGKEYAAAQPNAWFVLFSRRHSHDSGFAADARRGRTPAAGLVRELPALLGRMPHASICRTVRHGRPQVHLLFDYRIARRHPRGASRTHGRSRLWLRYLSGRLPVEPPRLHLDTCRIPTENLAFERKGPVGIVAGSPERFAVLSQA